MNPIFICVIVFLCIFGSALLAMLVARALPGHHLAGESKDAVKQGLATIATLSGLVLGLLVATAKGTYDTQSSAVKQMAANVLLLDRMLGFYGPETKEAREMLRHAVAAMLAQVWPEDSAREGNLAPPDGEMRIEIDRFYATVAGLPAKNDAQKATRDRALSIIADLGLTRMRLFAQRGSTIPVPFLVVLVFWLVILFAGLGLLSPRNPTVVVVLLVCTLSVSGAVFLILELDLPFDGIMRVSSAPLRDALSLLGQ